MSFRRLKGHRVDRRSHLEVPADEELATHIGGYDISVICLDVCRCMDEAENAQYFREWNVDGGWSSGVAGEGSNLARAISACWLAFWLKCERKNNCHHPSVRHLIFEIIFFTSKS